MSKIQQTVLLLPVPIGILSQTKPTCTTTMQCTHAPLINTRFLNDSKPCSGRGVHFRIHASTCRNDQSTCAQYESNQTMDGSKRDTRGLKGNCWCHCIVARGCKQRKHHAVKFYHSIAHIDCVKFNIVSEPRNKSTFKVQKNRRQQKTYTIYRSYWPQKVEAVPF
jgi:hypothetical protein